MGEYSKALSFYEKALEICQKTLPANHPSLAHFLQQHRCGVFPEDGSSQSQKHFRFTKKHLKSVKKLFHANHPDRWLLPTTTSVWCIPR